MELDKPGGFVWIHWYCWYQKIQWFQPSQRPPPPTKKVFERLIHILFIIKYYFIHFQSVYRIGIELLFLLCFMALIISLVYQFLVVALLFKFWPAVELVSRWFPVCVFFWRQKKKKITQALFPRALWSIGRCCII